MQNVIQLSEQSAAAASAVHNPRINLEILPYVPQMSVVCLFCIESSFFCEMFLHFPVSVPVWNTACSLCLATVYTEVPP